MFYFMLWYMYGSSDSGGEGNGPGCLGVLVGIVMLVVFTYIFRAIYVAHSFFNGLAADITALTYIFLPFCYQQLLNLQGSQAFWASVITNIICLGGIIKVDGSFIRSKNKLLTFLPAFLVTFYLIAVYIQHAILGSYHLVEESSLKMIGWYAGNFFVLIGSIGIVTAQRESLRDEESRKENKRRMQLYAEKQQAAKELTPPSPVKETPKQVDYYIESKYQRFFFEFDGLSHNDSSGIAHTNGNGFIITGERLLQGETISVEFPLTGSRNFFQFKLALFANALNTTVLAKLEILGDDKLLFTQDIQSSMKPEDITLDIKGTKLLKLNVTKMSGVDVMARELRFGLFHTELSALKEKIS